MIRTLKTMALAATLVAAGCGGSDSGDDSPTTPTPSGSLQGGYFASCTFESGMGNDVREALVFNGSNLEFRAWSYPSTNGSCTGLPILDEMDTGTFVLGAAVTVANPSGTGNVAANLIDVTMTSGSFYTIGWVSPSNALYVGDDSGANNGDTPALRPTALQSRARARLAAPASFTTLIQGDFAACSYDGGAGFDIRQVFSFAGSAMDIRIYDHTGTSDGSCGGPGHLTGGDQGTISLGTEQTADFGALGVTVSATPVDFVSTAAGGSDAYQLVWMDTYATTPILFSGDDTGTLNGSTALLRPDTIATWPSYRIATTPPAFPAVLNGTWDACVMEPGAPNVDRWERFVISGTDVTFSEIVYASGDGTCTGTVNSTGGGSATFTFGATTAATLGGFDVSANKVDVFGMYTIIFVDTMASPYTLYLGDETATAGLDATSDLKRPTVLQDWKPRFKQ